jgi:hypothetical protein
MTEATGKASTRPSGRPRPRTAVVAGLVTILAAGGIVALAAAQRYQD